MSIASKCNVPTIPEPDADDAHAPLIALLAALVIVEVTYRLSGGGDSGECELDLVLYADGRSDARLPAIPIGFSDNGDILLLDTTLEHIATEYPEGDWCNNEGGYGTVSFFPTEMCSDDRIVCDMTYREEGDYGDDDEYFEGVFDDLEPPEEEGVDNDQVVPVVFDISLEGAAR